MAQPIDAYLAQALADFEVALAEHPVKESRFLRAEKMAGARLFVMFLQGLPLPTPFPRTGLERLVPPDK